MFKVRRGDMPAKVPTVEFHDNQSPINSSVPPGGGFEAAQAGVTHTLRDHNGKCCTKESP